MTATATAISRLQSHVQRRKIGLALVFDLNASAYVGTGIKGNVETIDIGVAHRDYLSGGESAIWSSGAGDQRIAAGGDTANFKMAVTAVLRFKPAVFTGDGRIAWHQSYRDGIASAGSI